MIAEQTPNERLAAAIYEKLLAEGLITEAGKAAFIQNLAQGKFRENQWRAVLEEVISTKNANPASK